MQVMKSAQHHKGATGAQRWGCSNCTEARHQQRGRPYLMDIGAVRFLLLLIMHLQATLKIRAQSLCGA